MEWTFDTPVTDHERFRREYVEEQLAFWTGDSEADDWQNVTSNLRSTFDAITTAATEHAKNAGLPVHSKDGGDLNSLLYNSKLVVEQVLYALDVNFGDATKARALWRHRDHPLDDVRRKEAPTLIKEEIEGAVDTYLRLPFRSEQIERLLLDLLLAQELYAFLEVCLNTPHLWGFPSTVVLKRSAIAEWIMSNVVAGLFWAIIALPLWGLKAGGILSDEWFIGAHMILGGLFLLNLAWVTLWLPNNWWSIRTAKRKVIALVDDMNSVYMEMRSHGPISARHIEQRARSAADHGVVWPGPVFALLDDINARSGRF